MAGRSAIPEPAPGELEIVQALVNTRRQRPELEELTSPRVLARWLEERGLLAEGVELDQADLERVRALRENLRGLLRVNGGAPMSEGFVTAVDRKMSAAAIRLRFRSSGAIDFEPGSEGVDGVVDRLLLTIALAQRDGTWRRLKTCSRADCRQAYYDNSRNLGRRWCAPRCGNEFSKKASRARLGSDW